VFRSTSAAAIICALTVGAASASPPASRSRTVEIHVFHFVDTSRTIRLPNGRSIPRPLETVVRYPTTPGRHPLIVFGHGFTLTPSDYSQLLNAWAIAGYVVAAPVFPLGNANAPGGPNESDIINQPRDMSVVITKLLALNARTGGAFAGKIDPSKIAVAGHSDGAVTALAVAYDKRFRDHRIRAAIVLSGAELGGMGPFPTSGPPLLAMQGTADPINSPQTTAAYFQLAHRPKFLVWPVGASHLPPYTDQEPQLGIVERTTIAFLDHYLLDRPLRAFETAARHDGLTRLDAEP
jgi:pimeloyl-ACP methyl ester carboxylesterase